MFLIHMKQSNVTLKSLVHFFIILAVHICYILYTLVLLRSSICIVYSNIIITVRPSLPSCFPPKQRVVEEIVKTKMFPFGETTLGELSTLIHIENSAQKFI
jgi:hypothetical protein